MLGLLAFAGRQQLLGQRLLSEQALCLLQEALGLGRLNEPLCLFINSSQGRCRLSRSQRGSLFLVSDKIRFSILGGNASLHNSLGGLRGGAVSGLKRSSLLGGLSCDSVLRCIIVATKKRRDRARRCQDRLATSLLKCRGGLSGHRSDNQRRVRGIRLSAYDLVARQRIHRDVTTGHGKHRRNNRLCGSRVRSGEHKLVAQRRMCQRHA